MDRKQKAENKKKDGAGTHRPIHSSGDVHESDEGMPLTLAGGGYGGTSKTSREDKADDPSDQA